MSRFSNVAKGSVLALSVVAFVTFGLAGCGGDGKDPIIPEPDQALLRVVHLSPDAPGVDVFVNGETRAIADLSFLEGTDYLELDEGRYTFDIAPAGGSVGDSVLTIAELDLQGETSYTVFAFDELAGLQALALEDDYSGLGADEIRVRAIHAAPGVGQVDIWNIPESGDPTPLYENVDFGGVGDYLDLPADAYTIGFDVDDDAQPDLTFSLPALPGGTIANVFAVNDDQGDVLLLAQLQDSTTARFDPDPMVQDFSRIRVLHLSPDAPAVDVWVDGALLAVEDLAFPEGTDYLDIESGTYDFQVAPADTAADQAVLQIDGLMLEPDKDYTAIAYDALADIKALAIEDDTSGLAAGDIRVRAIHVAAGVGQVDIWNLPEMGDPAPLYENVDFGAVGNYIDLPAGAYTLGFDVDDDAAPDVVFNLPELPAGTVANVFAVTDAEGALSLKAQLDDSAVASIVPAIGQVRVLHLSPDAGDVDVYANSSVQAVVELGFEQGTGYLDLVQGSYTFDITPTGQPVGDAVLTAADLPVLDGMRYTAVAYGPAAEINAMWLEDDYAGLAAGDIRIRAIHTASAVGQVDIWNIPAMGDPGILYENVDYGVAGGALDLPAGAYTVGFDVDDDSSPDVVFDIPALDAGTVANVFAVSDDMGNVFLTAQLNDGTTVRIDPNM
jgi:hypothetical protein